VISPTNGWWDVWSHGRVELDSEALVPEHVYKAGGVVCGFVDSDIKARQIKSNADELKARDIWEDSRLCDLTRVRDIGYFRVELGLLSSSLPNFGGFCSFRRRLSLRIRS
jgi:hypothetical protein